MATAANLFYVALGTAASETDISAYCNSADFERMVDELESTTFGATAHTFIPGLKDTSISFDYLWDATVDGVLNTNYGVAGKSMVIGPAGNTSGYVKYSVGGFLSNYGATGSVDGIVTGSGTFRPSGVVTRGTF